MFGTFFVRYKSSMRVYITLLALYIGATIYAQTGSELLIQANRATLERDYPEAIELYNHYIAANPKDFRGYFNRGTTEYNAKMFAEAKQDFSKTLSLNPIYKEAYYYRGLSLVQLREYAAAINDYNHVLKSDTQSVPFLKVRAEAYAASGNLALALADLDVAVAIDKLSGDLYKRRAELKVAMKDIDGALRDYNSVEKLLPTYKMVHYIKGNLYMQIHENEFACEEYQKALDNSIVVAERSFEANCLP